VKTFLFRDPGQGFLASVGGAVVRDEVKFLARLGDQEPAKETDERSAVVAMDRLGTKPSAMDLEGRQQRRGSVALVFVASLSNRWGFMGKRGCVRSNA
jgi:hypothetical protein